jgi:antitoxin component YwqK of YwqJK toxin-antitoxin module
VNRNAAPLVSALRGRGFSLLRVMLVCVLGGALAGLLWLSLRARKPTLEEVPRERLTLREGRWCVGENHTPFTGFLVERYESGLVKSRSSVREGLLEGWSEGWYTNGQKQVTECFHAGVSHGLRTKWHANGRKLSAVLIVEGRLDGTFRRWNEDGTLAEEIAMKAGQPDGISRAYYPSGFLKAEARLRDGKLLEQKHWKEGEHQ